MHQVFPMEREDRSVSFLPWAHSFGQTVELHTLLSMGSSIAVAESVAKLPDNFLEVRPTLLISVPRIFNRIYDALMKKSEEDGGIKKKVFLAAIANERKRRALARQQKYSIFVEAQHELFDKLVFSKVRDRFGGKLKYAVSGGAALNPEVAEFNDCLGIEVYAGYGLTETSPICTANRPGLRKIGSIGKEIPNVRVVIDESAIDDGGGQGELVVYGPNIMKGYNNLPEETAEVITEDGGFRTGDRGMIDEEGFFYITGRIKEQYKLENGKYVVPAPLEEQIQLSPFIVQAFIHGENKPFNVALIVPDREALQSWAAKEGLPTDYSTLLSDEATRDLIRMEIEGHSGDIRGYEKIKRFSLIAEEFTPDNGLLTPTLKLKRRKVMERYGDIIQSMYEEAEEQARALRA